MSEDRQRILHLLSNGKLTVEEAEKTADSLGNELKPAVPDSDVRGNTSMCRWNRKRKIH